MTERIAVLLRQVSVMVCILCLSLVIPSLIWADDENSETSSHRLEPVVITATRTPTEISQLARNVSVIDSADIRNSGARSVEELLKYSLGVDIRQRGPFGVQADPSIRGANFSQVMTLINGVKVNDPQTAHHNFNLGLTLDSIERVEILHGHGSSLYGPDAFGGVINIITKKPEKRSGYVDVSYGDHSTAIVNGGFSEKRGDFGSSFSVEKRKSDGYRPDTDFNITTLSSSSTLEMPDLGSLELLLGYTDKEFGANDFYADYPSREWTDTVFVSMGAELEKGAILEPKAYDRRPKDKFVLDNARPDWYVNHHTTHVYGIGLQSRIPLGASGNVVLGGEGVGERIESSNLGDHDAFRSAAYAEGEAIFADRFILAVGIRGDNHSIYGFQWSPSASAGWKISSFKLRSSVGRTFRAPSFTDLYYESPANLGNPDLKPERAWSYELGADYYHPEGRLYFGVTSFMRDETNLIDWVKEDIDSPQWKAENVAKVQIKGIETALKMTPMKSLSVLFNYTFIESDTRRVSKYDHLKHHSSVRISYELPFGVRTLTTATYKKRIAEEGYRLLDVRISKEFSLGEIYVTGANILNRKYQEIKGVPMPGRWIQGGIKLIF